jgi:tetratricopeptide (TPR) repeat protein
LFSRGFLVHAARFVSTTGTAREGIDPNLPAPGRPLGEVRRHLHRALGERDDAKVVDLIGLHYYLAGTFDDAERWWRQAILGETDRSGTWWRIGKLELKRGRPGDAIEPLRRAIALQPTAIGPHYTLSLAYRSLGRTEEGSARKAGQPPPWHSDDSAPRGRGRRHST